MNKKQKFLSVFAVLGLGLWAFTLAADSGPVVLFPYSAGLLFLVGGYTGLFFVLKSTNIPVRPAEHPVQPLQAQSVQRDPARPKTEQTSQRQQTSPRNPAKPSAKPIPEQPELGMDAQMVKAASSTEWTDTKNLEGQRLPLSLRVRLRRLPKPVATKILEGALQRPPNPRLPKGPYNP